MAAGLHIGLLTASASRLGGGVFEAVVTQAELIAGLGHRASVFSLTDAFSDRDRGRFACPVNDLAVRGPAQVGYAPDLVNALIGAELDVLHLHGIWMYPSLAGAIWAERTGRPYIVSAHGMLDPWITARGRWKKALARAGYERRSWRAATMFHALTNSERTDIAHETGRGDAIVVPNPGPTPASTPEPEPAPKLVYIGRIHAKKNLHALIEAWDNLAENGRLPEKAQLTIAGWGTPDAVSRLEAKVLRTPACAFVGPVYGSDKADLIASARWIVLPSYSEGLPMGVLEAWAAGRPTVMTEACNLPEGFERGAALVCGTDTSSLTASLASALTMSQPAWQVMANAAFDLARTRFSRETIAAQWAKIYQEQAGRTGKAA